MQEPFFFEGGVVDLAADAWDFMRCAKVQRVVNKAGLRPDLANIAWEVLRQTLRTGREISTMKNLWWGFVRAASVLEGFVDDLRLADLPAMQAAWYGAERRDSGSMLRTTRAALCRWLEEVLNQPLEPADARRLARVLGWLRNAPVPKRGDDGTALSLPLAGGDPPSFDCLVLDQPRTTASVRSAVHSASLQRLLQT